MWSDVYSCSCSNRAFDTFINIFLHYFEICFPIKKYKVSNTRSIKWISDEVLQLKERLSLMADMANQHEVYKPIYKKLNSEYQNKLRTAKSEYYNNLLLESQNKNKTMWNIIHDLTGSKTTCGGHITIAEDRVFSDREISNKFNDFFTSLAINMCDDAEPDYKFLDKNVMSNNSSFF